MEPASTSTTVQVQKFNKIIHIFTTVLFNTGWFFGNCVILKIDPKMNKTSSLSLYKKLTDRDNETMRQIYGKHSIKGIFFFTKLQSHKPT